MYSLIIATFCLFSLAHARNFTSATGYPFEINAAIWEQQKDQFSEKTHTDHFKNKKYMDLEIFVFSKIIGGTKETLDCTSFKGKKLFLGKGEVACLKHFQNEGRETVELVSYKKRVIGKKSVIYEINAVFYMNKYDRKYKNEILNFYENI